MHSRRVCRDRRLLCMLVSFGLWLGLHAAFSSYQIRRISSDNLARQLFPHAGLAPSVVIHAPFSTTFDEPPKSEVSGVVRSDSVTDTARHAEISITNDAMRPAVEHPHSEVQQQPTLLRPLVAGRTAWNHISQDARKETSLCSLRIPTPVLPDTRGFANRYTRCCTSLPE